MLPAMRSTTSLADAGSHSQVQQTNTSGGTVFCKFGAYDGSFLFGRDAEDISGETVMVHTDSMAHGWTCWSDGQPEKFLVNFTESLPPRPAPITGTRIDPKTGQPEINYYTECRALMFVTDDGINTILEGNSHGIRSGFDDLLMKIKQRAADPANAEYLYPKVVLKSTSYENKYKKGEHIYNPVFEVVSWCNVEGVAQEEVAKIAPTRKKVEEDDVPFDLEPEKAKPVRRRKRAA